MYGELSTVKHKKGRPHLHPMNACKRDLKACGIDTNSWEVHAVHRSLWEKLVSKGLTFGKNKLKDQAKEKRIKKKAGQQQSYAPVFTCVGCSQKC